MNAPTLNWIAWKWSESQQMWTGTVSDNRLVFTVEIGLSGGWEWKAYRKNDLTDTTIDWFGPFDTDKAAQTAALRWLESR